jgi:hypothetical protein
VPPDLWGAAPDAALLIQTEDGALVALAASTSQGAGGTSAYALSMGVPLPHEP